MACLKGVNFVPSEYQKHQNGVCCHPGVFNVYLFSIYLKLTNLKIMFNVNTSH